MIGLVNSSGTQVVAYTYDAWGRFINADSLVSTGQGIGKYINHLGFFSVGNSLMLKGQTLDIGSTIYDDSHGVASVAMWLTYYGSAPFLALYDLAVKLFD